LPSSESLSIGEVFIQYYYLCQRKQHAQNDITPNFYREEKLPQSETNWITLSDVLKIKKIADNINFLRLYFLKSSDQQVNQLKLERNLIEELTQGNGLG